MRKLSKDFVNKYRDLTPPWGPIGYIVYKRSYSRLLENHKRTEEWVDTVERCVNAVMNLGPQFSEDEALKLFDHVFNLRCSFSGRALWQLGTSNVERLGGDSLQNCWCVAIDEPIRPFCFAFNELMLGGGVGYNITPEFVFGLPKVKHGVNVKRVNSDDVDFIVPDNREGWVRLLGRVLKVFFHTGKSFTYSTRCIRPKGTPIKTFGGIAAGSEDLVAGIDQIAEILKKRSGKKIQPIDALDIMNIIGNIVVSGNVRRASELALGLPKDTEFANAKNWQRGTVPNWRCMSNNSFILSSVEELPSSYLEEDGEIYGIVNLETCRKYGRLIDGETNADSGVIGVNPCGEIPLESYEACNLAEIFLPNIESKEMLLEIASLLYKVCKSILQLPFLDERTEEVIRRNQRMGISLSGILQSSFRRDFSIFDELYKAIKVWDNAYSRSIGAKESIKITTIKPSGTLSLLAGVTPGIHPSFASHYVRRVRMASNDPLVEICKEHGYEVEPAYELDGSIRANTCIVSFPIATPEGTVIAKQLSAIDQLQLQKDFQTYWADNSISITVYYEKEEIPAIRKWLQENFNSIKTVSFLPRSEHKFAQAPMEEISKEQYNQLMEKAKPITKVEEKDSFVFEDNFECKDGLCPVR